MTQIIQYLDVTFALDTVPSYMTSQVTAALNLQNSVFRSVFRAVPFGSVWFCPVFR